MKDFKKGTTIVLLLLLLAFFLFLVFWGKPNELALGFISGVFEESSSSLLLLTELKIGAAAGASVSVPLVSGSFNGVNQLFGEAMGYLELSNLLLGMQVLLLTLSQSILLKILILGAIVLVFFGRTKTLAYRLLIIFLLINPGLSFYTLGVKWINEETNLNLGTHLNEELKKSHTDYLAKKKAHENKLQELKAKQLASAQAKGKEKISFFDKAKDAVEGTVYKAEDDLSLAFDDTLATLKAAGKKLISLCINLFTHTLFLFLILPFGYYLMMKHVFKKIITPINQ